MKEKEEYLNKNVLIAMLLSSELETLSPDMGYYVKINNIEIARDIFPDEYNQIQNAYFSVIRKLRAEYKKKFK